MQRLSSAIEIPDRDHHNRYGHSYKSTTILATVVAAEAAQPTRATTTSIATPTAIGREEKAVTTWGSIYCQASPPIIGGTWHSLTTLFLLNHYSTPFLTFLFFPLI
ncbi:hypothetical protein ACFE04_004072 [Oxalis oulophora]